MSLTWKSTKNGIPIAKIDKEPNIIFLLPNSKVFKQIAQTNVTQSEYTCPYCKVDLCKKQTLLYHVKRCKKKNCITDIKFMIESEKNIIKLPLDDHEMIFLSGPPKSGKSWCTNQYCIMAQKILKKKIFLFTRNEEDETLTGDFNKIIIHPDLLNDKFKLEDFQDSVVVFDDIESSEYKKVTKYLYELMNDMIRNGRHNNISVIATNHDLRAGQKTKNLLNLMTVLYIFPKSGCVYHIRNTLKLYLGMSPSQINRIMNLPSRWVAISKENPQYVTYEHGCYMLGAEY